MKTGVFITTFNRGKMLARTLETVIPAATEVGASVLIVNDGGDQADFDFYAGIGDAVYRSHDPSPTVLHLPQNRGLACAMNVGLSWFLADPSIEAIHYIQDDVEVDPLAFAACNAVLDWDRDCIVTGHHGAEHPFIQDDNEADRYEHLEIGPGINVMPKKSCRATHMLMSRHMWSHLMPIPSRALGLPSKTIRDSNHPERRGTGSGVDWYCCRDAQDHPDRVLCIPGIIRSFAWKREDSCWDNQQIAGEDAPLSRGSIERWVNARR